MVCMYVNVMLGAKGVGAKLPPTVTKVDLVEGKGECICTVWCDCYAP